MLLQTQWHKDYNLLRDSLSSNSQNIMQFKKKACFYTNVFLFVCYNLLFWKWGECC